jgi:predicted  nucleic acid-binding Zn-ribbon protein
VKKYLVGSIIGSNGWFVNEIKKNKNERILIKRNKEKRKIKICDVEGKKKEIESELEMIREKLKENRYKDLNIQKVWLLNNLKKLKIIKQTMKMRLVEGVKNDVIL